MDEIKFNAWIARDRCDYYRRVFILNTVRQYRDGTHERYY